MAEHYMVASMRASNTPTHTHIHTHTHTHTHTHARTFSNERGCLHTADRAPTETLPAACHTPRRGLTSHLKTAAWRRRPRIKQQYSLPDLTTPGPIAIRRLDHSRATARMPIYCRAGGRANKICLQQGKSLENTAATNSHTGRRQQRTNTKYNKHAGGNQVVFGAYTGRIPTHPSTSKRKVQGCITPSVAQLMTHTLTTP